MAERIVEEVAYIWEPAEAVWNVMTDANRHVDWFLMPCRKFGARSGSKVEWGSDKKAVLKGKLTRIRHNDFELAHTLSIVGVDEPDSMVEWDLEQQGEVTEVRVKHIFAGPRSQQLTMQVLDNANWSLALARLKTLMEVGDPMPMPSSGS